MLWPDEPGFAKVCSYPAPFLIQGEKVSFPSKSVTGIIVSGIRFTGYQARLKYWGPIREELAALAGKPWEEIEYMYQQHTTYVLLRLKLSD